MTKNIKFKNIEWEINHYEKTNKNTEESYYWH